jgi:hypothetical protein
MNRIKLIALIALFCSASSYAEKYSPLNVVSGNKKAPEETKNVVIKDLGWMDHNKMDQELTTVDELAQTKIGSTIHRDLSDIQLLQRLIDGNYVARDDYGTQQAMGVVLGNIMLADFPTTLEWKVYEDKLGRSRAVCVKNTSECLFPVTMLSRRMEVGTKPNVQKIYDDAILLLEKHLPKLPYDGGIMYRLPRQK